MLSVPCRSKPAVGAFLVLGLAVQATSCGGGSTEPPVAPGLRIVSLATSSDTVMALPGDLLVVEVRDGDGVLVAGAPVEFTASPGTASAGGARPSVFVCAATRIACAEFTPTSTSMQLHASAITDAAGRAAARVQHGIAAGSGTVTVTASQLGYTATATFVTRAGAMVEVAALSRDTALYVGTTAALAPVPTDRFGNPGVQAIVLESLSPGVVSASGGTVTAIAAGRARVVARGAGMTDTIFVSVVPAGRLVIGGFAPDVAGKFQLVLANTDGSARRRVALSNGHVGFTFPSWTHDGRVLFTESGADPRYPHVYAVDTATGGRTSVVDTSRFEMSLDASYPRAGGVFFYGRPADGSLAGIFHSAGNGSSALRITDGGAPSASPDGTRLAYVTNGSIVVRDLASGTTAPIASTPYTPFWSPEGSLIAYVVTGASNTLDLWVVKPDGTGRRTLTTGIYSASSWSPDGAWIATVRSGVGVEIIRVADGLRIPIPRLEGATQVSWRP